MFSCEFCEISKNPFFHRIPLLVAFIDFRTRLLLRLKRLNRMQNNFLHENTIFIETILRFINKLRFWNFTGTKTYSVLVLAFYSSISSYPIQPPTTPPQKFPAIDPIICKIAEKASAMELLFGKRAGELSAFINSVKNLNTCTAMSWKVAPLEILISAF